ncbi:MAG: hypothetical protein PSV36_03435 [Algoriphagus sp.]|nr:hypothetical protein [Algoriphagus sp.]
MKNQLFTLGLSLLFAFACTSKEEEILQKPLSEQSFEFEIYDSLVVDYLGNLYLADISKDGSTFLLVDHLTDSIFVTGASGEILHKFNKQGDGPGLYQQTRLGPPTFLNETEIIVPAFRGFYLYSLTGEPTRTFLPEFQPGFSMINQFKTNIVIHEGKIFFPWEGRIADEFGFDGKKFQVETKRVEILDLNDGKFTPALPFPKESKFNTNEKTYLNVNYSTGLASKGDTLFVSFRNEPVLYGYHISNLDSLVSIRKIPFPEFIEKEPKDAETFGSYEMRDIYTGSMNQVIPIDKNQFIVNYARGLTNEEYDLITSETKGDNSKFYEEMLKKNIFGWVVFDGKAVSSLVKKHKYLGNIDKYISNAEIWFSPDYSEVEKDYVVIYKTRLISR